MSQAKADRSVEASRPSDVAAVASSDRRPASLDNPWVIIGLVFFIAGAAGIPAIWMSRAFSLPGKIVLTVVAVAYTLACLAGFWLLLAWIYRCLVGAVAS